MAVAPPGVAASSFLTYSAAILTLDQARGLLKRPDHSCRMEIARGAERLSVTLPLRRLVYGAQLKTLHF